MNQQLLTPPPVNRSQQEETHLQDYINVVLRHRKTSLIAFTLVFLSVAIFTFLTKPLYEADATLHVKDEKGKLGQMQDMLLNGPTPLDSELEILKSRTNLENVVRQLHLDWRISSKSKGLVFNILEFKSTAKNPKYVVRLTSFPEYTVTDDNGDLVGKGVSGQLLQGKDISLVISNISGKTGDRFDLQQLQTSKIADSLRKSIKATEVGKKTNIISIKYRNNSPQMARNVVDSLVQVYLDSTVAYKSEEASRAVGFIESQMKSVRDDLDSAEKNLQEYKSSNRVVQLDAEVMNLIQQMNNTDKQKTEIHLQKKQLEFALLSLKDSKRRGFNYSPSVMKDDPLISGLATKLVDLEIQKRSLMTDNTESHPSVKVIQEQIDELLKKLQSTYETGISDLVKQEANVAQNLAKFEDKFKKLPEAERNLARLMRLSKVNADIYTYLLQKHEESRIAKASTISNIRIVDPALLPDEPIVPNKKKNILLGFLVGLMVSMGLAFFMEYLDDTIKDAEQAKRVLGLPLLAIIPFIGRKSEDDTYFDAATVCITDPKSQAAEAFRGLRTGIHFSAINRQKKVLLLTSTFPSEGKSTVATNLAITFAQTGAKVLIVDCDMRRPTVHIKFGHKRIPGLTELLAGDVKLADSIHNSGIPNLHIICAGTIPPNPAELLGSPEMESFMQNLRGIYDTIIIDAPPLLAVTDSAVLSPVSDLLLMVVEPGRIPLKVAARIKELLSTIQAPVAGMILSDRRAIDSSYGYYYYGKYGNKYGKSYGYGYYQAEPEEEKIKWWQKLINKAKGRSE